MVMKPIKFVALCTTNMGAHRTSDHGQSRHKPTLATPKAKFYSTCHRGKKLAELLRSYMKGNAECSARTGDPV